MEGYDFPTHPIAKDGAVVKGDKWRFTVLCDGLVRCEWAEDGQFEDRASTFAIKRDLEVPKYRVTDIGGIIDIVTDRFQLTYDKTRFNPGGLTVNVLGKGIVNWGARWRFGEPFTSLGGTARTLDNVDGRCDVGHGVVSREGFSAIDDSETMLFDGKGFVAGRQPGDREDIYVFAYGHDYEAAIEAFYQVSGKQPVLPRWALGNWWSRYYAYSAESYLALMDKFNKEQVPLSIAVLDMDWHLVDDDRVAHSGWTGYTWDEKLFPDPKGFLGELLKRNLKICPNDHPAEGIWSHEDAYEDMAKEIGHDTTHKAPILFDCTSPKFMKAYLKMFTNLGFHFSWIDWQQGPHSAMAGVDPLWVLNHLHFLENKKLGDKPMIFSRYGGPGSHRYPVGFSGDSIITWDSLNFQPEFTQRASNIGYGWWSHDIGGHMLGTRDDEMATRWIQLGVFSPLNRLHSSNSQWTSKEPWEYTAESEKVMSDILRLRHRLIPYLYTMNVVGAQTDRPIVRPIYWSFANRHEAYQFPNQFYFGTNLLVAPITTPRDMRTALGSVKAWLPPTKTPGGHWVDIFTGSVYDSDRIISLYRPLDQYPVLAPEGSIVPLDGSAHPSNGGKNPLSLDIFVVAGADANFDLIEDQKDDEGATEGSGERTTTLIWNQNYGKFTIFAVRGGSGKAISRSWVIRFLSTSFGDADIKVTVDDKQIDSVTASSRDEHSKQPCSFVTLPPISSDSKIELTFTSPPILEMPPVQNRLHQILKRYQLSFALKDHIWEILTADKVPASIKASRLLEVDTDKAVIGPFVEVLLSDSRV